MLDTLKQPIVKLIAAYETEKSDRERLAKELEEVKQQNETYRKQILELERQIDNQKLSEAFKATAGNGAEAKKKVNTLLKEIQKAIQASDLGINPQNDGKVVRLIFPQLTEERRKELTKQVKKYAEDAKVAMRNIRRDGMDYVKKLKKNTEITEDDQKKAEKDLQDLLDKYIKKADDMLAAKEKELMAI